MKKYIIYTLLIMLILASCSSENKQDQLKELKVKRDKLNQEIAQLEIEIKKSGNLKEDPTVISTVSVEMAKAKPFNHYIEIQGDVKSDKNINIPAEASGIVTKIFVSEGQSVKKGQVIAQIDDVILKKNIEQAETNLDLTKTIFERQERLWSKKIGSEIKYLESKTNKESLEKQLSTLKEQMDKSKIKSPINGTIDKIDIKEGEMAVAGMPTIRVIEISDLKILSNISEKYITQIKDNSTVEITLPSINFNFKARITSVAKVIDPDNRTFGIEIKIPNNIKNVKANMLAVVKINDYTNPKAITVPLNSIVKTMDGQYVYIVEEKEGKTISAKRTIITGNYDSERIEVLKGLKECDKVITFGFQNVSDGQIINVK